MMFFDLFDKKFLVYRTLVEYLFWLVIILKYLNLLGLDQRNWFLLNG